MMPLGAPSISKYASLVRPDAQIVALRAHCTRTALKAPPYVAKPFQLHPAWAPTVHGTTLEMGTKPSVRFVSVYVFFSANNSWL